MLSCRTEITSLSDSDSIVQRMRLRTGVRVMLQVAEGFQERLVEPVGGSKLFEKFETLSP